MSIGDEHNSEYSLVIRKVSDRACGHPNQFTLFVAVNALKQHKRGKELEKRVNLRNMT